MTLSEEASRRLADIVERQPTKNSELQELWGLESGSEVHQYLEGELKEYYFRDDNSLIRATDEAAELVDAEPGIEGGDDGPSVVRVPERHRQVVKVLAEPDERSMSVVAVLHALQDEFGIDSDADEVREALQSLRRKGIVDVEYRTVPTFKLVKPRGTVRIEPIGE